jgi:hypothetical protein
MAQVSLYSQTLGVAIAQAADASGEIQSLRQQLEVVELEGVLVPADALHVNRPFPSTSPSAAPTPYGRLGGVKLVISDSHAALTKLIRCQLQGSVWRCTEGCSAWCSPMPRPLRLQLAVMRPSSRKASAQQ